MVMMMILIGQKVSTPTPVSIHRDHDKNPTRSRMFSLTSGRPEAGSCAPCTSLAAPRLHSEKTPAAAHLTAATRGDAQPGRLRGFRVPHPDPDLETAPPLAGSGFPSQEKKKENLEVIRLT